MAKESNKPQSTKVAPVKLAPVSIGGVAVAKVFSITILIAAIVVIGILFYQVMASFFVPLFLAALLVVIFRPVHSWILVRVRGGNRTAAVLTTTFIILLVLLPAGLIISVAAAQGTNFFRRLSAGGITESLDRMRKGLSLDLPLPDSFRRLDVDMDELAQPLPLTNSRPRIQEVEDIVRDIHAELSIDPTDDLSRDQFLVDLQTLKEGLDEFAILLEGQDSFTREQARKAYDVQYQILLNSRRLWTQKMLGSSFIAQIKMLANPSDAELRSFTSGIQDFLQPRVLPLTQMASQFVFQTAVASMILVIALYFFFADGNSMVQTFMRLSPLDDEYERRLLLQFDQTSRAVVLASVLSAIAQGILAAIGFWFAGLPSIVLLFLATTFMGLVPFLGAASVWVPCAIYLGAVEHRWGAAIALAIFGVTVISSIDNVIKVFVLRGHSQLHPLLALLSVLGGLQVFGPIGILVGPMVVVFLQTLLEILNHELEGRAKSEANNGNI